LSIETLNGRASKDRKFLETLDFEGQTVYDIGAYIGILTAFFAKKVGAKGKVIAFEPNPDSFSQLLVNTAKYPNVTLFNLGAGKKCEKMTMVASIHSRATGTVEQTMKLERITHQHREWSVQIVPIDDLKNLPPPDFIKIDVEGLEYPVLQGMKSTLLRHTPGLFIEIHGVTDTMKRENMQKIADYLHSLGYELYNVETHKKVSPSYMPLTGHILASFSDRYKKAESR
jgi:FkbM family methyltransferase